MKFKSDWFIYGTTILFQLVVIILLAQFIKATTKVLLENKNKLTAFEKRNESMVKLVADYQQLEPEIQLLDQSLPDKDHLVDLIDSLEKQASASGIATSIDFSKESVNIESGGVKSLNINLRLKGTYFQILDLIKRIEKIPQIVSIEDVSLQSPKGIEGENEALVMIKCFLDPNF